MPLSKRSPVTLSSALLSSSDVSRHPRVGSQGPHVRRLGKCGHLFRAVTHALGFAVLLPVSLALIVSGQMTIVNAQQPQPQAATFHGRVVDARSGEPIAKVKIIVSSSAQSTTTDDQGTFTLTNVPVGELNLYITTVGYGLVKKTLIVKEADTAEVLIALN